MDIEVQACRADPSLSNLGFAGENIIAHAFAVSCEVNMAKLICLLALAPKVTPANVSGGGGSRSELVITWEVSKLARDPLTHGGGSQTSLFSADVGLCFINNS